MHFACDITDILVSLVFHFSFNGPPSTDGAKRELVDARKKAWAHGEHPGPTPGNFTAHSCLC